jgi:hypothetical protein
MSSPTQRSLKRLRDEGYHAEVTEKWNQFAKIRQDLFGFVDILAVGNGRTIGVQTTSYSNMSARVKKIMDNDVYPILKSCGWKIVVHGWKKNKSNRWEVVEKEL